MIKLSPFSGLFSGPFRVLVTSVFDTINTILTTSILSPRSPTVSNPAPDSCLCRATAPRLRPLAPPPPPPDYVRFSCCSPFASAAPRLRPFQLLIPIASASAAAPRLPTAARFDCCSRLHASACSPNRIPAQCSRTLGWNRGVHMTTTCILRSCWAEPKTDQIAATHCT